MDLSPKDLLLLQSMAHACLFFWAMAVLLLLWQLRLKRPGISWFEKMALGWSKGKLSKEKIDKARERVLMWDRVLIKVAGMPLVFISVASSMFFLFSGSTKFLALKFAIVAWLLIPFYIICHLVVRTDNLILERMQRFVTEKQGEAFDSQNNLPAEND